MDTKHVIARFNELEMQRKTIDQTWDIIKRFFMPYRGEFFRPQHSEHEMEWRRNREVYDSTGLTSLQTLASSIHGSLTSPAVKWFDLEFQEEELNNEQDAKEWLEKAAQITYDALQDSNFNLEANECYTDLVGYGTSIIVEEVEDEDTGEIHFSAIPVEQGYFEQDKNGQVYNFYRKLIYSPLQICDKFGDKTPEYIKKQAKNPGSSDIKHEIIFCVYTRKDKKEANKPHPLVVKERPYGYKYVIRASSEQIGDEGGYYEMPAFIPRWRQTVGSMWGNSPAMIALPDVLTINELVELILKATEKVVDPATLVTERGLLADLDLTAGGLTVVRTMEDIAAYESKARFDVSSLEREELKSSIRSVFFVDQLELKESPAMTATEVQVRYELMQRLLGPTLGRLQNDFLSPLISRTFNIQLRAGKFGDIPEVVADYEGQMNVKYMGPLARAQKIDVVRSIQEWTAYLASMAEIQPDILDIPDWDAIARLLADLSNVPTKLIKKQTEIDQNRKNRKAQQDAAIAAETGKMEAEGNKAQAQANSEQEGAM